MDQCIFYDKLSFLLKKKKKDYLNQSCGDRHCGCSILSSFTLICLFLQISESFANVFFDQTFPNKYCYKIMTKIHNCQKDLSLTSVKNDILLSIETIKETILCQSVALFGFVI